MLKSKLSLLLSLSLLFGAACAMESENSNTVKKNNKETIYNLDPQNSDDESNELKSSKLLTDLLLKQNGTNNEFLFIPNNQERRLFEKALESAPQKIKAIIKQEQLFPQDYKHRINRLLLVGPTGNGKSLIAKAMACKIGRCFFIRPSALMKKYRNETSNLLIKTLKEITKHSGKKVIIIDEINQLTDNYKSENSDSGVTAATLLTFLDDHQMNPNLFVIGTTNHSKKLPEELQSRFHNAIVQIAAPDVNTRRNTLRRLIMESNLQCTPNLAAFLDHLSQQTKNYSIRDLEQLIWDTENFAYELHPNKPYIDQTCLERALKARQDEDIYAWGTNQTSDEERRH